MEDGERWREKGREMEREGLRERGRKMERERGEEERENNSLLPLISYLYITTHALILIIYVIICIQAMHVAL